MQQLGVKVTGLAQKFPSWPKILTVTPYGRISSLKLAQLLTLWCGSGPRRRTRCTWPGYDLAHCPHQRQIGRPVSEAGFGSLGWP